MVWTLYSLEFVITAVLFIGICWRSCGILLCLGVMVFGFGMSLVSIIFRFIFASVWVCVLVVYLIFCCCCVCVLRKGFYCGVGARLFRIR